MCSAAGNRVIAAQLGQEGETISCHKVSSFMREAGIASKQPNKHHRYKDHLSILAVQEGYGESRSSFTTTD